MQRRWRGERATITKQPVEIRETPERNWGLVGRHDREILVARGQSFWRAFFFLFFFFCQQITGIQSFHLWQIFIRDARILRLASHARCNCFRFETFELYLISLMLAQSEFPTRKLYSALVLTRERMSRLILDRTKKSGEITFGDE